MGREAQGSRFRVQDWWYRVSGFRFRIWGLDLGWKSPGLRAWGLTPKP